MSWDKIIMDFGIIAIIVPLIVFYREKYIVKLKHKNLILKDEIMEVIEFFQQYNLFAPLLIIIIAMFGYMIEDVDNRIFFRFMIAITFVVPVILFVALMLLIGRNHQKKKRSFLEKVDYFMDYYLGFPVLCTLVVALNYLVSLFAYSLIKIKPSVDIKGVFISITIFYVILFFFLQELKRTHVKTLGKKVKSITIHYNYNGKLRIMKGVDFDRLSIEKDYVSFYCKNCISTNIIQSKDLVRINYHY